jgi:hypothetical protein
MVIVEVQTFELVEKTGGDKEEFVFANMTVRQDHKDLRSHEVPCQ